MINRPLTAGDKCVIRQLMTFLYIDCFIGHLRKQFNIHSVSYVYEMVLYVAVFATLCFLTARGGRSVGKSSNDGAGNKTKEVDHGSDGYIRAVLEEWVIPSVKCITTKLLREVPRQKKNNRQKMIAVIAAEGGKYVL